MNLTSVFTSILVLCGSCYNVASLSLDIGDVEFQQVTVYTGESVTLACQAGVSTIDDVYWLSIRYRRFISRNDVLFDYGTESDNFDISVDEVDRIYFLHVHAASEDVSGVYMCYSSTAELDKQVLWAGEVIVLAGYDFSSSPDTSVSEKSNKPNPPHSLECSASYIPPMMNLINVDEVEMEVRCSWSAFDHPDASPTLFCNGKELLSKYFVGEMVTARVMLKDVMECFNFTCALMGAIGEDPFKEMSCSYMQEIQSGLLAPVRQGVRVDPMYSVIQQGMDAVFVCIASFETPGGTFQWNVSSRLFDPEELISSMEITQSNKASTLLIKNVQVLTDEPVLVRCQLITDDQRKKVMMSEALLTVMTQMSEYSNKTSDPVLDKTFGMTTVLTLVVLVLVLFAIIFCFAIYLKFCRSKNDSNAVARPTENANNNENRKRYVSMRGIWNRNITRRAKHPVPTQRAADNPDIISQSCPIPPGRHPAQRKDHLQESLSRNRIDVSSLRSNPVICIDDSNYIVPDGAEGGGGGGGGSPIVLRARNPRHPEAHYSSTDVMVGSREMMSARSSQEGMEDRDGYLVPSIVVDQDLEEYVYATSEGTNGKPGTHRKTSSCHDLSNYYSACYE